MKKPYVAHEKEYRRIEKRGARSWGEGRRQPALDRETRTFMTDVLAQPWAPRHGRALELGCGTGPMLAWLGRRGWRGDGVDISATAIRMARRQNRNPRLRFRVGDVTRLPRNWTSAFDLVVDGHCHHCLTEAADRRRFFVEARRVLRPGGAFILQTMARPVLAAEFRRRYGLLRQGVIYIPWEDARGYRGAIRWKGRWHLPTRWLGEWRGILREMRDVGLEPRLFRVNLANLREPHSGLSAGAVRV